MPTAPVIMDEAYQPGSLSGTQDGLAVLSPDNVANPFHVFDVCPDGPSRSNICDVVEQLLLRSSLRKMHEALLLAENGSCFAVFAQADADSN